MTFKYTISDQNFEINKTEQESYIMKVLRWFFYPKSQLQDLSKYNCWRF